MSDDSVSVTVNCTSAQQGLHEVDTGCVVSLSALAGVKSDVDAQLVPSVFGSASLSVVCLIKDLCI